MNQPTELVNADFQKIEDFITSTMSVEHFNRMSEKHHVRNKRKADIKAKEHKRLVSR